eukprot:6449027-Heterocapsa_arctica.AAC.1
MSGAALAPHRPVSMRLHPGGSKLRHLVYRSALPLPRNSPFGPAPRPQDWTPADAAADVALRAVQEGDLEGAAAALATTWK